MTRKPPPAAAEVLTVGTRQLAHARGLDLPAYQSDGAAGMDLIAAVDRRRPLQLAPGARALIPTGLVLDLPPGLEAQVRPRSGLALRHGVSVLNSPGTIDCDYRGEVKVLLANFSDQPFTVCRGQRIAQLVFQPVARVSLKLIGKLSPTRRGAGGFGSTGVAGSNAAAPRPPRKRPRPAQRRPT